MDKQDIYSRFQEVQRYIGWQLTDADRVRKAGLIVRNQIPVLVADFYEELSRHPEAAQVITGGEAQVNQLKATLQNWLNDLFDGNVDADYVMRRWRVGWRHVEIGLMQVYVNAAMARLRAGILRCLHESWDGDSRELGQTCESVNRALDLDLSIVQDAYQAEKKNRSESFFRSLIEAADCAIIIVRDDFRIVYVNPFARYFSGYGTPELVGSSIHSRMFGGEKPEALDELLEKVQHDGVANRLRINVTCRDATKRQLVWNARALREFENEPAILLVGHDITEIAEAQERALQAERLAAIGQTVTGLAHESRNAFQRIQACLEMLTLEVDSQPEALELVSRIHRAQEHLHHLYEEVRSYAAPIVLARQVCDMAQLVREIWDQLDHHRQPRNIHLAIHRETEKFNCSVDPFAMGQVIRNIMENAIAASPDGKSVEVTLYETKAGTFGVAIQDHGSGIDAEALPQVFTPFFTTKTRGTGLGMAIAKRIVDAHGGQIRAANHAEGGAVFHIEIPRGS